MRVQLQFEKAAVSLTVDIVGDPSFVGSRDAPIDSVEASLSPTAEAPVDAPLASPTSADGAGRFTASCGVAVDVATAPAGTKSFTSSDSTDPI
jgi:hypothetical protein